MSTVVAEEVARDTFQYRRVSADLFICPGEVLRRFQSRTNATPWKCHAPKAVHVLAFSWNQLEDGTGELITTFAFGNPGFTLFEADMRIQRRYEFLDSTDFNTFDFGELWEPEAQEN